MRAIQITEFGGPEVLTLADLPDPQPAPGLSVLDVHTAGVNYADTHQSVYRAWRTLARSGGHPSLVA